MTRHTSFWPLADSLSIRTGYPNGPALAQALKTMWQSHMRVPKAALGSAFEESQDSVMRHTCPPGSQPFSPLQMPHRQPTHVPVLSPAAPSWQLQTDSRHKGLLPEPPASSSSCWSQAPNQGTLPGFPGTLVKPQLSLGSFWGHCLTLRESGWLHALCPVQLLSGSDLVRPGKGPA